MCVPTTLISSLVRDHPPLILKKENSDSNIYRIECSCKYRGYYTVARRYEFYVQVARTISHE